MGLLELTLLAVGLSMDAFAVSICKGLAMDRVTPGRAAVVGLWFGGFQGLMPLVGWVLGSRFAAYITAVDHWIAFALLVILGLNMLREAWKGEEEQADASLGWKIMLAMAVATSIDALAVGISLAVMQTNIVVAASFIGAITFLCCLVGAAIGKRFGALLQHKARILGGVILVGIGLKIFIEHMMGG